MTQITGRVTLQFNGKSIRSLNGAKIMFGGIQRTPVTDDQGFTHYSEKSVPGGAEAVIPHGSDTNIAELQALVNVTMTVDTDTGKQYMGRGQFIVDPLELTASENGDLPIKLAGMPLEEI